MGRVEQAQAAIAARLDAAERAIRDLSPLITGLVRLEGRVGGIKDDVSDVREQVGDIRESIRERDKSQTEERRSLRLALLGLAGTILAALIAAIVTVLLTGAPH